jgi:hypothetical protein
MPYGKGTYGSKRGRPRKKVVKVKKSPAKRIKQTRKKKRRGLPLK